MNRRPTFHSRRRAVASALAAVVTLFAAPAAASAADRWVDAETGSDASNNPCTVQASPCKTISQASGTSQMSGDFGTIHVDQGTYAEQANIAQANVLLADDFVPGDSGVFKIAPASGVAVFAQANATVQGFEITSPTIGAVAIAGDNAKLVDNTITAQGLNSTAVDLRNVFTGTPTLEGNTIIADSGDEDYGVDVQNGATGARVIDNEIGQAGDGFAFGVRIRLNGAATVEGNTILGTRQDGGTRGKGILVDGAHAATIRENLITSPTVTAGNESYGVQVDDIPEGKSVTLQRNRILGMTGIGVSLINSPGEITLEGDLIAGSSDRAMYIGAADPTITNATIAGNDPIELNTATVAIDSSILETEITTSGGAVSCDITYTRGPAITEGGNGCAEFQTTAEPGFVSPSTFDYHLAAGSPLIDKGNPAAPAAGAIDIDGDPRALDGDGACPRGDERDMGYDEVVKDVAECPATPDPEDPEVGDSSAPQTTVTGERKQFGSRGRFVLSSDEPGSTFECRLDRGQFVPCGAKVKTRRLNLGRHTLFARATDASGNTDPTPVAMKFKLKPKR